MTNKLSDLENFIYYLKTEGFLDKISVVYLEYYISKKFGYSDYHMKNVKKALLKYGFLKILGIGLFKICDGWNPKKMDKETERLAIKSAEQEVDNLIQKVSHGKKK